MESWISAAIACVTQATPLPVLTVGFGQVCKPIVLHECST